MWGINIYKGRTVKWPLGSLQFKLNQPTGLPGLKDDHNPPPTYQPKRTQPSKLLIFSVVLTWKPLLPPLSPHAAESVLNVFPEGTAGKCTSLHNAQVWRGPARSGMCTRTFYTRPRCNSFAIWFAFLLWSPLYEVFPQDGGARGMECESLSLLYFIFL